MKNILTLLLVFSMIHCSFSQIQSGYYKNIRDSQEKLIITEDSIYYKLDSEGGMISRTLGRGEILWKREGKKCRLTDSSWSMFEIVGSTRDTSRDSIQVCLINSNDSLFEASYDGLIHLYVGPDITPGFILNTYDLDSSGCCKFLLDIDSTKNKYEMHFLMGAWSIGGIELDLRVGNEFVIRSKLDLTCEVAYEGNWREKFCFKVLADDRLKVYDHRVREWKEFYLSQELGEKINVNWILQCE